MHSQMMFFTFLLLSILSVVFAKNNTAPSTPFASSLIGRSFFKLDTCYRARVSNQLTISKRMVVLQIKEGIFDTCPEKYELVYRKPQLSPMIIKYPEIIYNTSADPKPDNSYTEKDRGTYCDREQKKIRIKMFPVNKTRGLFINTLKKILPLMYEIRDFGCTDEDGYYARVSGRAYDNTDAEAVTTYIHTIAFQYQFCI